MKPALLCLFFIVSATWFLSCSASVPAGVDSYIDRGCYLGNHGRYREAISEFTKAITRDERCGDAYGNRAVVFLNLGELERALHDLNKVLALEPQAPASRRLRAVVFARLGAWNKAIADYTVLVRSNSTDPAIFLERAALFAHLGDEPRARRDWHKAVALDSKLASGHLGHYDKYGADCVSKCQEDCRFVDPEETLPICFRRIADRGSWSKGDKEAIAEVFCKIKEHSPGLVQRAINGQKLCFIFSRTSTRRTGMDSTSGLHYITCYVNCFTDPPEKLEWMLVHELVHQVDVDEYLSGSADFCTVAKPLILRCREGNSQLDWGNAYHWAGSQQLQPRALTYGLPTLYAATEPSEMLADCTAANVLYHWQPPQAIEHFLQEHLLTLPPGIDQEASLLGEGILQSCENNLKAAIATYARVLKLDPSCAGALIGIGTCWDGCREPEIALYYIHRALQIFSSTNLPPDCHISGTTRAELVDYSRTIAREPGAGK